MHDIKSSGVYYLTGGVTDKPTGNGGYYSVSVFNNDLLVGTYISTDNFVFAVKLISGTWTYTQLAKESEIDALNSKKRPYFSEATFTSGADLNQIFYGTYCCNTSALHNSILHKPTGMVTSIWRFTVVPLTNDGASNPTAPANWSRRAQIIYTGETEYWRVYQVDGSGNIEWGNWIETPKRSEITALNSKVAVPSKLLTKNNATVATIYLPSNGRFVIFETCNGANSLYAMLVTVYSNGAAYKLDLAKSSDVSAELSTNTLTITSIPNVSFRILVMSLEPSTSMDDITIS